jgi:pyruvate dehydrogenase E2 component (dihydrolipoamide acetyltransferase)
VHEVTIPALGMAMTEAVLTQWLKQPGDPVCIGDVIAEIETDKSNVDLESPADGILGAHLVAEGAAVPIGGPVVRVLDVGESEAAEADRDAQPVADEPATQADAQPTSYAAEPDSAADPLLPNARSPHALSPRKRQLARLEADAEAFFAVTQEGGPTQAREAAASAAATATTAASTGHSTGKHRGAIAAQVAESWRSIPHFAVQREVLAVEADACLAVIRERDIHATFTDLLLRAYARAIATVVPSNGDVGLAVATPDGVMMPIVAGVASLDVASLVARRAAAVKRGQEGKLSALDLATVPVGSLSNLGTRGVDSFTGIIPVGQQLLLTVGRVAARPVVVDGRLAVRTTVVATLNVDHRHLDGDQAAVVLGAFERQLGALRAWAEGESA